jgi:type IV pilus assembly protein PilC
MATFAYSALTERGTETTGKMQAEDARTAATQLRQRGLRVLRVVEESDGTGLTREIDLSALAKLRSVPNQALVFFFRQMAFMLRAGLPVLQALELAESQVSSLRLRDVLKQLRTDIEAGSQLSQAMAKHPDVFSKLAVNLVVAGENTGELDLIVDRLATHLEKRGQLRAQMLNAMIYPTVVVLAAIGVATFLVVKIIPKFGQFLATQGKPLPASTQFLIDLSAFVVSNGLWILGLLLTGVVALVASYQTQKGRLVLDRNLLRLPVMGKLMMTGAMAQMTWGLSMLLRSGVTVFDGLRITSSLLGNRVLSNRLIHASDTILTGRDLASSLRDPVVPGLVTQMIAIGEHTGTLDRVLQELGTFYEHQLEVGIKRLSAMIEPALILVIGGMVGFVYYAFFQALFALTARG